MTIPGSRVLSVLPIRLLKVSEDDEESEDSDDESSDSIPPLSTRYQIGPDASDDDDSSSSGPPPLRRPAAAQRNDDSDDDGMPSLISRNRGHESYETSDNETNRTSHRARYDSSDLSGDGDTRVWGARGRRR